MLRTKANIIIDGGASMVVKTLDIAAGGLCLGLQSPLKPGQTGHIAFDMYFSGHYQHVESKFKVTYCLYCSREGFKAGLQFLNLDMAGVVAVTKYMNS